MMVVFVWIMTGIVQRSLFQCKWTVNTCAFHKKSRRLITLFCRTLALDGCYGNGTLCGLYSLCTSAQPQSLHTTFVRLTLIWRFLGLFFSIRVQCQCHGQSCNQTSRQSSGSHGQKTALGRSHGSKCSKVVIARQTGLPIHTKLGAFFHVGLGWCSHARSLALLCHAIWCLQKGSGIDNHTLKSFRSRSLKKNIFF